MAPPHLVRISIGTAIDRGRVILWEDDGFLYRMERFRSTARNSNDAR